MPRLMSPIKVDHIYNGQGFGDVADALLACNGDTGILRPWRGPGGKNYVTVYDRKRGRFRNMVTNAPAMLTWDAWRLFDRTMLRVARPKLRVWGDVVGEGLTFDIPDGMSVTMITEQTMTDVGNATISMDALRRADRDRPTTDLRNFPLPIIHADFSFSLRQILSSQRGRMPLDSTMLEMETRRIAETIDAMFLGTTSAFSFGGGAIYGFTSKPQRFTKVMTAPTAPGWTPDVLLDELLDMIQTLEDNLFEGPFIMYYSRAWSKYLNNNFSAAYAAGTLLDQVQLIEDISSTRKVYGLSGFQIVLWQPDPMVVRAINAMPMRVLQWESHGGLARNYKLMCMMIPQLRSDARDLTGVMHGTGV